MTANHPERYTASGDPVAEGYVQDLVDEVVSTVQARSNPVSILLQGSFARGQGTVRVGDDGEPRLWRDLDLVLVYRLRERPSVLGDIADDLNDDLPGVEEGPTPVEGGEVSLAQMPRPLVTRWRDLKTYELAHDSVLLAGDDIRDAMAVCDGDIPIESGLRFLYQKALGMCLIFPTLEDEAFTANYEISKLYLEITSVLALLAGSPAPSFGDRIEVIRKDPRFGDEPLVGRAEEWARYKVDGEMDSLSDRDPTESWLQAREDLDTVLELCHEHRWGWSPNPRSPDDLVEFYEETAPEFLPRSMASLVSRRWPPSRIGRGLARAAHLAYGTFIWLAGPGDRTVVRRCPLFAVYMAAWFLVNQLEPGKNPTEGVEATKALMDRIGLGDHALSGDWARSLNEAYFAAANPMYGVT